jgi:hypothetical protein
MVYRSYLTSKTKINKILRAPENVRKIAGTWMERLHIHVVVNVCRDSLEFWGFFIDLQARGERLKAPRSCKTSLVVDPIVDQVSRPSSASLVVRKNKVRCQAAVLSSEYSQ